MTLGLRTRIALTAVASIAAAMLVVILLLRTSLWQRAVSEVRDTLLAEARLMALLAAGPLERGDGPEVLDPIVDEEAHAIRARATIIAADGRVLADSELSGAALLAVENHAARPEVREALATGSGSALRRSDTVGHEMVYAAVAVRRGGRTLGVARLALSLAGVEEQAAQLYRAVAVALAVALSFTALLTAAFSAPLAGPLREIMAAAREFASGNLSARIPIRRRDELGELALILNQAARQLAGRLAENARDRARTEAILSAMEDGVLAVDHEGRVLLANGALRSGLGIGDPVGRHYVEAVRQREVGGVVEAVLRTGERRDAEVEIRQRYYALSGVSFPGFEGKPQGAVLTFHDVTERKRVERIRRDFVANASHELRTPLTSIRGFVEALEDGAAREPATAERFLGKIRVHADRMAALVEDLLELSRLESGERPPRWAEVRPAQIAEEVVASLSDQARRKQMALTESDLGAPMVVSDAERLLRILESLVDNAIKYTPAGGRVEVVCGAGPDGRAWIDVRDDGPGIAPEHLPRLFERFYRVDRARSRELGGTGLGLAIVKHLAESLSAIVTVASEPGKGTTFKVSLPSGRDHTGHPKGDELWR
jgi:two-component system phosphate regulon sensor histidine kinase PhoR